MKKKKKKKGFTLVELLAVIVVLAIILVIAVPKILDVIKSSRENSLISSVKLIARNAEQKLLTNEVLGENTNTLSCDEVADINTTDYKSCNIDINEETKEVTVTIEGKGKFSGYTCSGTKNNVTCGDAEPLVCAHGYEYSNYRRKESVSIETCTSGLATIFGDVVPVEVMEPTAQAVCTGEDAVEELGGSVGIHTISDLFEMVLPMYGLSYEDIDDYFDADIVGCSENYLAQGWQDITSEKLDGTVTSIAFHKSTSGFDGSGIDVSQAQDGGIKLYFDEDTGKVDIVSNETIYFPKNSSYLFSWILDVESINFNNSIDTSNVTNMYGMFEDCTSLVSLDLSGWNTSKVTDMSYMFEYCNEIEILDVSSFDTSNVTDMSYMFYQINREGYLGIGEDEFYGNEYCLSVIIGLSNFNTGNVTNMDSMFSGCSNLEELDVSSFNTSKVTNMSYMFSYCENLISLDLSSFDTSNVTDMNSMFYECFDLEHIYIGNDWTTENVTDSVYMFFNNDNLPNFDSSYVDATNAYVGGYLECKSGLTCTCTYSGC